MKDTEDDRVRIFNSSVNIQETIAAAARLLGTGCHYRDLKSRRTRRLMDGRGRWSGQAGQVKCVRIVTTINYHTFEYECCQGSPVLRAGSQLWSTSSSWSL